MNKLTVQQINELSLKPHVCSAYALGKLYSSTGTKQGKIGALQSMQRIPNMPEFAECSDGLKEIVLADINRLGSAKK